MSADQSLTSQFVEFERACANLPAIQAHNAEMRRLLEFMKKQKTKRRPTDKDIVLFLISKNESAKTQYHSRTCPHIGKGFTGSRMIKSCSLDHQCPHKGNTLPPECPRLMAPTSLETAIFNLKEAFYSAGKGHAYDEGKHSGNPAASQMVRNYVRYMKERAKGSLVSPIQATPIFVDQSTRLLQYLQTDINEFDRGSSSHPFNMLCKRAYILYFLTLILAGTRGGDLVRIHPLCVWLLPNGKGVLLSNHQHKTSGRSGKQDIFAIEERIGIHSWSRAARAYEAESRLCNVPINHSPYLFMNHSAKQTGCTMLDRDTAQRKFSTSLRNAQITSGLETLHGLRVALAIERRLDNIIELAAIDKLSSDMRWKDPETAARYSRFAQGAVTAANKWTAFITKCRSPEYAEFLFFQE